VYKSAEQYASIGKIQADAPAESLAKGREESKRATIELNFI
jgi:hypothetical protein